MGYTKIFGSSAAIKNWCKVTPYYSVVAVVSDLLYAITMYIFNVCISIIYV